MFQTRAAGFQHFLSVKSEPMKRHIFRWCQWEIPVGNHLNVPGHLLEAPAAASPAATAPRDQIVIGHDQAIRTKLWTEHAEQMHTLFDVSRPQSSAEHWPGWQTVPPSHPSRRCDCSEMINRHFSGLASCVMNAMRRHLQSLSLSSARASNSAVPKQIERMSDGMGLRTTTAAIGTMRCWSTGV